MAVRSGVQLGVIERIIDEAGLVISSITGTSAGAMNAVVLAHGVALDGEKGVMAALETSWRRVNGIAGFSPSSAPHLTL